MVLSRRGPRDRWFVSWTVAGLLLVLLPLGSPAFATPTAAVTSSSAGPLAASTLYAGSFAARAGFDPSYPGLVEGAAPTTQPTLIVVTFEASNLRFFDTPHVGAAPLTVAQVATRYGLSPAEYASIAAYFTSAGLSIVHTWPDRLALTVEGAAPLVGRAFGTTLVAGTYLGRPVSYPETPPTLPGSIEPVVAAVVGLSSGFTTFTLPRTPPTPSFPAASTPQGSGTPISPAIARSIYGVSGLYNLTSSPTYSNRESIALLLWGDGYSPTDIGAFFSQYYPSGFPAPTVRPYPVDGAPLPSPNAVNDPDQAAPQELTLDIEWSGSMAPGATLDAVYAPDGPAPGYSPTSVSMADALHQAVTLDPAAISMSFGTAEATDAPLVAAWGTYLAEATQLGITLLAATGDLGGDASSGCTGGASPEYPASSPDVIAVGGTDVTLQQSIFGVINGFSESGWSMSGGGFSAQFSAPSWQSAAVPAIASNGHRGMPDVSATAAFNLLYYKGQPQTAGGTSFATPLWAGLIVEMDALHGSSLGLVTPRLYAIGVDEPTGRIGDGLVDVTSGANCVANAGPGWDAVTGWGSPRGVTLYEELTATFVNLSIRALPPATPPGGSITISAHLANATTGAAIAGIPVVVSLAADENLGPCVGSFGAGTPTTDAAGNVSVALSVPWCYLGSHAVAQVTVTSDGLYGINTTIVGVDLLALAPFLVGITTYPYNVVAYATIMIAGVLLGVALGYRAPRRSVPVTGSPEPPSPPPLAAPMPLTSPAPVPDPPPRVGSDYGADPTNRPTETDG